MDDFRIKIWYLLGNLEVGGAERTVVDLANSLDPNRFDVTIWTIENSNPLAVDLHDSVALNSLNATGKIDLRAPMGFIRAVRAENPDILQSFLFYDNALSILAGRFGRNTRIITGVRAVPNDPGRIRHHAKSYIHQRADYVVSNSKAGAEYIVDYDVQPSKVMAIHNGRDLTKYASGIATSELYDELGLEEGQPTIGTVGRLIERKGHLDLINAWPKVLDLHPDAQLLIVGDGPLAEELQKKTVAFECTESVHVPGHRDDIPDILDLLDVFVFPSHFEGLPGALLEAMAAGLPIVTTPVDGNDELVVHEGSGIHVPPKDPDRLAESVNHLLSNQRCARLLGKNAAMRAKNEFSLDRMVNDFENLYATIVDS